MENRIQFIAKHNDWFVVKKMNIDDKTENIEIARLLSSIDETVLNKLPEYLPFDMKKLEEIADEIYQKKKGRVKEEDVVNALMKLKSPSTTKKLGEITDSKEGKEILKVILNNIILERLGIKTRVDPKLIEKYIEKMNEE
ncbi:DUF2666 domain-containing protein [Methanotorris igneus]|uniref:DUF2666 domain-containing protein n=1 Tax=Methanotorris igneus (strain DSM 5666 / JCM 11834 / Kol 5) TaxID=880724 RepID=F6BEN2_METIK|nr:DUF2666 domain-containing protein [Methanotorris igneus]AEF96829.1 hypothetical protein Metig_1292 [Methanotorris igneus Kol 5]